MHQIFVYYITTDLLHTDCSSTIRNPAKYNFIKLYANNP